MFAKRKLLFVEDSALEIKNISSLLRTLGVEFVHVAKVDESLKELTRNSFDFLLTDLHIETKAGLESPDGLQVIEAAIDQQPNITIVAASSDPRTEIVNEALATGAHHFIRKPLSKADELEIAFRLADERRRMASGTGHASSRSKPSGRWQRFAKLYPHGIILGEREQKIAQLAARKKASCIITGETGTGKEEAAKLIHRIRCEVEGRIPFIAVNCATITGSLAESLLFGHKKGAFTGADETTTGYITEADGGILFLDEIQTLSIPIQQKLLRVLNDGTYHRLGETKTHRSQFQLIVASTKDLSQEVLEGRFLVDIQMRMLGLDFVIAPLRERERDLPALVALFLSRRNLLLSDANFDTLVKKLAAYHWAGNIRQLFKSLEAWLLNCELDGVEPTAENFPIFRDLQPRQDSRSDRDPQGITDFNAALLEDHEYDQLAAEFERAYIINALARHDTIHGLLKAIKMPRSTLDSKRRKHGLL